jgi:hypothetical protein
LLAVNVIDRIRDEHVLPAVIVEGNSFHLSRRLCEPIISPKRGGLPPARYQERHSRTLWPGAAHIWHFCDIHAGVAYVRNSSRRRYLAHF